MDQHLATVAPGVQKSLQEKGQQASALRAEALAFLKRALAAHPAPVFRPLLPQLLPAVLATVEDRYYKVSAEALRVCSELVRVIRSSAEEPVGDRAALVPPLFSAVLARLQATEQDQEVKEAAIACMGHVIAALGDAGNVNVSAALSVLLDRLQNEITRQTAAKAFALIAVRARCSRAPVAQRPANSRLLRFGSSQSQQPKRAPERLVRPRRRRSSRSTSATPLTPPRPSSRATSASPPGRSATPPSTPWMRSCAGAGTLRLSYVLS